MSLKTEAIAREVLSARIEHFDTANLACEALDQLGLLLGILSKCGDDRQRDVLLMIAQNTVENYSQIMEDARTNAEEFLPAAKE